MKKILSSFFTAFLIITILGLFVIPSTYAETTVTQYTDTADKLKELGLLRGGNNGYELDRAPTRLESGVMLVRLLGKEKEALASNFSHPFSDVPAWGSPYVGYMYEKGLTKGINKNQFGSTSLIDTKSYVTFVLRALEYSDTAGDFSWNEAILKGKEIGLIEENVIAQLSNTTFLRDHMVYISYQALNKNLKNKEEELIDKLVAEGAVDASISIKLGLKKVEPTSLLKLVPTLKEGNFGTIGKIQGLNETIYTDGYAIATNIFLSRTRIDVDGKQVTYDGTQDAHFVVEYILNGQYKELTGILDPFGGTWEPYYRLTPSVFDGIGSLKIYGDNQLLFETSLSSYETIPVVVDITGVNHLKIELKGEEFVFANPIIK